MSLEGLPSGGETNGSSDVGFCRMLGRVFLEFLWLLFFSVCVLVTWTSVVAPLPPGMTASGRAPVAGVFIHGHDSFHGEFWAYQTRAAGVFFILDGSRKARPSNLQKPTADEPFVSPPGGKPSRLIGCRPYDQDCHTKRIAGLRAFCDTFLTPGSATTCTSSGFGPSRGLTLSSEVCGDEFPISCSQTEVDAVIERALIDPKVFDDVL